MDKSKLRPATPDDLVKGNKIIVEDASGAFLGCEVDQSLTDITSGAVRVEAYHYCGGGVSEKPYLEEPYTWCFLRSDFQDSRHGDFGLKLWVQTEAQDDEAPEWSDEVFDRAQISKGDEIIRPATGTLTENKTEGDPVAWLLTNSNGNEVLLREHPGEWPGATVEPLYRAKRAGGKA